MKRSEGRKARQPFNGIMHRSLISMLSLFIFSAPGYGSTDVPVNVTAALVTIKEAALFAGSGADSGLASQGVITAVKGDIGGSAASAFLAELQDGEADYTEAQPDSEPLSGTVHAARPPCQDSCSL